MFFQLRFACVPKVINNEQENWLLCLAQINWGRLEGGRLKKSVIEHLRRKVITLKEKAENRNKVPAVKAGYRNIGGRKWSRVKELVLELCMSPTKL